MRVRGIFLGYKLGTFRKRKGYKLVRYTSETVVLHSRNTSEMVVLLRMQIRIGYRNRQKNSTILTKEIPTGKNRQKFLFVLIISH
jgi:hypothetical protein